MNRRSLLLLGGAAVVSVGAAILVSPHQPDGPNPDEAGLAFPGLIQKLSGAMTIEVRNKANQLTLKRESGETWVLPSKGGYPVRQERVRELLVGLTELRLTEARTSNPALLSKLGLDDPEKEGSTALLLRVLDAAGNPIAALVTGRRRVRTQGDVPEAIYVRRPGENQAWLAEGRLPIDADPALWIDRDLANLPRDRVLSVAIKRADEPAIDLTRTGDPDGELKITKPADAPAEQAALDEVGRAFEYLTFNEVKRGDALKGEPIGEARFGLTDKLTIVVKGVREAENVWITLTAEGDDEAARLNAKWRNWAFQVGSFKEKSFMPRLDDLKPKPAPAAAAPPGVTPPVATPAPATPSVPARPAPGAPR